MRSKPAPAASETVALEVRHYGEAPDKLALYDDDDETFDYEKGEYSWAQLTRLCHLPRKNGFR